MIDKNSPLSVEQQFFAQAVKESMSTAIAKLTQRIGDPEHATAHSDGAMHVAMRYCMNVDPRHREAFLLKCGCPPHQVKEQMEAVHEGIAALDQHGTLDAVELMLRNKARSR